MRAHLAHQLIYICMLEKKNRKCLRAYISRIKCIEKPNLNIKYSLCERNNVWHSPTAIRCEQTEQLTHSKSLIRYYYYYYYFNVRAHDEVIFLFSTTFFFSVVELLRCFSITFFSLLIFYLLPFLLSTTHSVYLAHKRTFHFASVDYLRCDHDFSGSALCSVCLCLQSV